MGAGGSRFEGRNTSDSAGRNNPSRRAETLHRSRHATRRGVIEGIDQALRRLNLDVEFRIGGAIVARMGPHAQPSLSARLLGLGPVEFHALAMLGKWLGM